MKRLLGKGANLNKKDKPAPGFHALDPKQETKQEKSRLSTIEFPLDHSTHTGSTLAEPTDRDRLGSIAGPSPNMARQTTSEANIARRPTMPNLNINYKLPMGKQYHVFLAHESEKDDQTGWDTGERVSRVNGSLQDLGFATWFDGDRGGGDLSQVSSVIDESAIVIVFITQRYLAKVGSRDDNNSKKAFEFAERRCEKARDCRTTTTLV
jgi:hypothetical protein